MIAILPANWLIQSDIATAVCGNGTGTGRCPPNYTCLPDIGKNPNNGYTNFDHFGWAMLTSFQLITLDYWENPYDLVLRAAGAYYFIFFIIVVMFGAYYVVNLVLAVVAASYEKEARIKKEAKEEEQRIMLLRKRKERMERRNSNLNPREKFRHYGKKMSKAFSKESILSWATDVTHFSSHYDLALSTCIRNLGVVLGPELFFVCHVNHIYYYPAFNKSKDTSSTIFSESKKEEEEQKKKSTSKFVAFTENIKQKYCSWTCCPAFLKVQEKLVKVVSHSLFEGIITVCIIINTLMLSIDYYNAPYSEDLEEGNKVLTVIFIAEAVLKILALNPVPYIKNPWNAFDFIIVCLSILDLGLSAIDIASFDLSIMRSLRMLRIFKLAKNWRTLNVLITIIFGSLKEMGNLTLIVVIVIYIFAVIGMQLVGQDYKNAICASLCDSCKVPRWNFTNFYASFLMVFRILCGEWLEPLYDCLRCSKIYFCIPLFLLTFITGNFLMWYNLCNSILHPLQINNILTMVLNLFLALLLNFFSGDKLTATKKKNGTSVTIKKQVQDFLLLLRLTKPNKQNSGKVEPVEKLGNSQRKKGKSSHFHQQSSNQKPHLKDGLKCQGISNADFVSDVNVESVKSSNAVDPTSQTVFREADQIQSAVPSHQEVPTVSAMCNTARYRYKYENGSAVMVPETLEEAQVDPGIEMQHARSEKSKTVKTKENSEEHVQEEKKAVPENNVEEDNTEASEDAKKNSNEMQPCFPVCCSKCCCCGGGSSVDTPVGEICFSLRMQTFRLVNNRVFDAIVLFVILASTATLTLDDKYTQSNAKIQLALKYLDYFYTAFFNLEMILKIVGLGLTFYFTNVWTLLDFFLVVVGWLGIIGSSVKSLKSLRSLRTLRALRPLRAISRWEGMRLVVNALVASIPSISNVMLVCLVFWLIFGIVGVQIYGGKFFQCLDENGNRLPITVVNNRSECESNANKGYQWVNAEINFDNILSTYIILLQVATFEGWVEIMAIAADTRGVDIQPETGANIYSLLYFVAFIVVGSFFTLNLFIGVIIDNFNTSRQEGALVILLTEDQKRLYGILKRLTKAKPKKTIPPPENKFLFLFYKLVNHKVFEPFNLCLIVLNVLVMASDHYNLSEDFSVALYWFNLIFTALFTVEAILKLLGLRLYYFTQAWNIFDILVVVFSIVGNILDSLSASLGFSPTILRVFRVVRLGRLLRLVRSLKGIRKLLYTLIVSIPALFNIGLLLTLVMFIYSILGMNLFRNLPRTEIINDFVNFETFANSMLLLFRLTTAAGWNEILQELLVSDIQPSIVCVIYMSTYIIITFLVIVNMYVAIILENFNEAQEQELAGITDDDIDMYYEVWSTYDPYATQFIAYEQLSDFLDELKPPLKIPKPNAVKIAALNLPLTNGHKLHCLDILKALSCVMIGNVTETDPLKKLHNQINEKSQKTFPIRLTMQTVSTTLMIRKEIKAAMTIQKAFRKWQQRKSFKQASFIYFHNQIYLWALFPNGANITGWCFMLHYQEQLFILRHEYTFSAYVNEDLKRTHSQKLEKAPAIGKQKLILNAAFKINIKMLVLVFKVYIGHYSHFQEKVELYGT
ncbi:sodium channel protein type 9 subunit alpha-like [Latimeria chalumnae]|uniref:sodium channel protein type 9 subunit alpha-like n=1 Tax=Latimeria chalumnae TaxID=7897 RepID=UPI00313BFCB4